jgi:hypothetical protein
MELGQLLQMAQAQGLTPLQAIAQVIQQARSEQELMQRLSSMGEPPANIQPQIQYPQTMMRPATPGTVPHVPQTRGEAETNPSLGQMLA